MDFFVNQEHQLWGLYDPERTCMQNIRGSEPSPPPHLTPLKVAVNKQVCNNTTYAHLLIILYNALPQLFTLKLFLKKSPNLGCLSSLIGDKHPQEQSKDFWTFRGPQNFHCVFHTSRITYVYNINPLAWDSQNKTLNS